MVRRGTTLVELLLVASLTVLVVGALAGLYGFTMSRLGDTTALFHATDQTKQVADKIEQTVRNAVTCSLVNSGGHVALKCVMPALGTDVDGDGYQDHFWPTHVTRRGIEEYGTGDRVWFYQADATGAFGTNGTIVWRARRTDDSNPTSGNADSTWSLYYGGQARLALLDTLSFSVDSANKLVQVSVGASVLTRAVRAASGPVSSSEARAGSEVRQVYWRNWRQ